jgi:hypothetical protein
MEVAAANKATAANAEIIRSFMGNSPFGLEPWKSLHHVDLAQVAPREYELLHTSLTIRYSTLLGLLSGTLVRYQPTLPRAHGGFDKRKSC